MKQIFVIAFLIMASFSAKAQSPSFEETVTYINDIFKENKIPYYVGKEHTGYYVKGVDAKKDGKIILYHKYKPSNDEELSGLTEVMASFNLFDVKKWSLQVGSRNFLHMETESWNDRVGSFSHLSEPTAKRLEKAFTHLRSLCSKKSDPFGD